MTNSAVFQGLGRAKRQEKNRFCIYFGHELMTLLSFQVFDNFLITTLDSEHFPDD